VFVLGVAGAFIVSFSRLSKSKEGLIKRFKVRDLPTFNILTGKWSDEADKGDPK
jgi:hypothetical protein